MSETRIENGIEWYRTGRGDEEDCQCARCGSSAEYAPCGNCGGDGYDGHDCGEDCCPCLFPDENVVCDWCRGRGGAYHCLSSPEWCNANPMAGREGIESTALNAQAWSEVL
jgi:hypothetical protein